MGPGFLSRRLARALARRTSVILCYHGVGTTSRADDPDFLRVPEERFTRQVDLLRDAGFTFVTVSEFAAKLTPAGPPPGYAALSFDDGLEDNYTTVWPILRRYGIPATVYVVSGLIAKPNPWLSESAGVRMMNQDELRALAAEGVELGAHTVSHADLSLLDRAACLREMVESREAVERVAGRPVTTFAYPFCHYGEAAVAAAREAGFAAAVTCHGGGGWDRYTLQRSMITGTDGIPTFVLKLSPRYQRVFRSAPVRTARHLSRPLRHGVRSLRARARP